MIKPIQRRPLRFVPRFVSELPFTIDDKAKRRLQNVGQYFGIVLLVGLIGYLFLNYNASVTVHYNLSQKSKDLSQLGPKARVASATVDGQQITKLTDDLVYFTTAMPFQFDTADVKVTFKNDNEDQTLSMGFQDDTTWHYTNVPFDIPYITNLNWQTVGLGPVLYQRTPVYMSVNDFVTHPPKDAIIGTYGDDMDIGNTEQTKLSNYQPASTQTTIDTPFRGTHTLYVYLDHEPFQMTIEKQDLNWYEDPDPVTVKIYKGQDLVYTVTGNDDGITNASHTTGAPQEIKIKNPSQELPESGVYKVVIMANSDTLIKRISTNLHKIVFQGPIFLAGNASSYPDVVASTSATTLYTNALSLSALTYHGAGEQTLQVGDQQLSLNTLRIPQTITPKEDLTKIVVPQNDVVLDPFQGYFAFSADQFFQPTTYHVMPITNAQDATLADYIITQYKPPHIENGWQVNEYTFDINNAYINKNRLSWLIKAPDLKENGNAILIKDIQVTYYKKGWL